MAEYENPISVIDEDHCWNLLAGTDVGRLATVLDGQPEIFPVNFVVDNNSIVFRTAEGTKLAHVTAHHQVAFEIDRWNDDGGWSVVLKGTAEKITDAAELQRAEKLPLLPWVPTVKVNYVRVTAAEISGRHFEFGEEPTPETH